MDGRTDRQAGLQTGSLLFSLNELPVGIHLVIYEILRSLS